MSKRTKKVGPAGRYQARYGVRSRTQVRNVEIIQRSKHICPTCGHQKVKRVSAGIWQCRKCQAKFTGGAYIPQTEIGQNVKKMLKGEIKLEDILKEKGAVEDKEEKEKA